MDGDGSQRRQPDSKARRMLAQFTGMVYEQAFDELRRFVNYIMTAIENDATQEHVYELLEDLTGQIQDFYEIEYEHRRHVRDNHLQDHDHEFRRRADYLSGSRQHIRTYIDHRPTTSSTQRPIVDAHAEVRKTMKSLQSEADQVRQEIQAISSALNKEKGQLDQATKSPVVTSSANVNNSATVPGQPTTTATTVVPSAPLTPSAPPLTPLLTPATPKAPVKSLSTADLLTQLATAITESSEKKNRLPPMEPPIFDGNLLKFPTWLNSLEGLVETEAKSVPARLHYLGKYTTGPAFEAIAGYLGLQADDSYDRAKAVLVSKYGNHMCIAEAFRVKLHDWPAIRRSDPIALGKYADFLWQCHAAMDSVGHLEFLNNSDENVKLTKKLPVFIADRWNRTIHRWQYGTEEDRRNDRVKGVYPPFKEFCMFVQEEARVAEGPCNFHQAESASSRGANKGVTNFATNAEPASQDVKQTTGKGFTPQCHYCRGAHFLNQCSAFIQQPPDAKKEYARANALCFGCLRRGHSCRDCPNRNPALMGDAQGNLVRAPRPAPRAGPSASVKQVIAGEQAMNSMIVLLRLRHQTDPEKHVLTYGILDTQSDACIIKEKLAHQLGVEQEPVNLKLITMSRKSVVKSSVVHGLSVRGINEATELTLPKCYTRAELPANRNNIPRFEEVYRWPHLRKVAAELPAYRDDIDVGILIGFNCSAALLPQECVYDNLHHPYGVRTALGWSVVGLVNPLTGPRGHETFCNQTSARDVTAADVKRLFDHKFQDLGDERTVSTEDSKFLAMMDKEITQEEDGHYSLPLPLRDGHAPLPENRHIAERCLQSIGRKFKSNAQFKEHYCKFMNDMIARGHAEVAPPLTDEDKGRYNLVMHHGVYHPKKPGKLRAVFNISKEHLGVSLNGELMTGPDQINNLAGVLIRFRRKGIAITCDVKQMFYQVRVHERDRNLLRFLWFKDDDEDGEIIEYRMVVHPFGATSSPCIANYAFKKMARDHVADFDDTTIKFVLSDFYVDDGLTSVDTQGEALATIEQSHELCKRGGFWLQKFLCNDLDVMQAVPLELRVEQMQQLSLLCGQAGIERSLGIEWDIVPTPFSLG